MLSARVSHLRVRHAHEHSRVTFVELFFDLVFVFAITQISHLLIAHFSLAGALQAAILTLAVWWVWIYTAWVTNWLDPAKLPVRLALMALMLPGLLLSAAIPQAFEARGIWFAAAYAVMQVGRTLFFLWAVRGHREMVRGFQRIGMWLSAGAVVWIAGGLADGETRLVIWLAALGIDLLGPSVGYAVPGLGRARTAEWNVEGGHMAERCGLFVIIALGESLLVTGATFSGLPWTLPVMATLIASLVGSLAMWWLYFDTTAEMGTHTIRTSRDPGRLARLAYTYLHLPIVAGIVVSAAADEFVLSHPSGHSDARTVAAVLGGSALFLIGDLLFKWSIVGRLPLSTLAGVVALGAAAPLASHIAPVTLMAVSSFVLVAVAGLEAIAPRRDTGV